MALHKLKILNEKLLYDNVPIGTLATVPPEGIRARTETSIGKHGIALRVCWRVEERHHQLLPLEILKLRMGGFFPDAMFVGGRRYE